MPGGGWIDGGRELSRKARERIDAAVEQRAVSASAISCWEIGMLVSRGRLELTSAAVDRIARCEALPFFSIVPMDGPIALRATALPPHHADPADRISVATALAMGAPVVTKDRRLAAYDIETVW